MFLDHTPFFMNDILIFCEGKLRYVQSLNDIINPFCKATRMTINKEKTSMYVWGLSTPKHIAISHMIGTQISKVDYGMKYLGFNLKACG
jgi:hypothetical protein